MPGKHILLVEDDAELLAVLLQVLEQEGYRVSGASRRDEAAAILRNTEVDLIVADSILRGGNGDDVAKSAGRLGVPVVMMSGEPARIAALSQGPAPFLAKPFHAADLLRLVAQLLA